MPLRQDTLWARLITFQPLHGSGGSPVAGSKAGKLMEGSRGEPVCRELLLVDPGDALRAAEFMHRLQPVVVPALSLGDGYLVLLGTMEQMPYPACTAVVLDEKGLEELRRYALVLRVRRVLDVPESLRELPRAVEEAERDNG